MLLASLVIWSFGWPNLTPPALSFLSYCAVLGGMILAWRFHSRRIFFVLCVLLISGQAVEIFGRAHLLEPAAVATIRAISILLPVNIVFISFMRETGLSLTSIGPAALLPFVESAGVFVLGHNEKGSELRRHIFTTQRRLCYPLILFIHSPSPAFF